MYSIKEWFSPKLQISVAALTLASIYALMIPFYGLHGVDDAWTLSYDYYYLQDGYEFGISGGNGAVAYFGKTQAFLYGLWAEIWGWERLPMRVLSTLLVVIGALLWGAVAWHFTRNKNFCIAVVILCLLLDSFVSIAVKTRPDALVYMLSALAILLACKRNWFLAGLVISIAVETHLITIVGLAIVISVWLSEKSRFDGSYIKKYLPRLIAGGLLGIAYYLSLHFEHLQELIPLIQNASSNNFLHRSFLYMHFFEARYNRYIVNLAIFLLAYGLFYIKCSKNSQLWRFLHYATLGIIISDLITGHAGHSGVSYAIHAYPIFVLVLLVAWQHLRKPKSWLIAGLFCFMLPQYTYVFVKSHDFYFPTYISLIEQHAKPKTVHIGHFAHWFAFNREQTDDYFDMKISRILSKNKQFVWIRDSVWEPINARPSPKLRQLSKTCPMELFSSFTYAGRTVRFEHYDCRNINVDATLRYDKSEAVEKVLALHKSNRLRHIIMITTKS